MCQGITLKSFQLWKQRDRCLQVEPWDAISGIQGNGGILLLWNCRESWVQEIEFVKNHLIIRSHGFVGEAFWKSLSRELEGKTTFPFWVACPSCSGMKLIDETEGEGSVSVNVCSKNEAVYLCIQISWRVVGKGWRENVAPQSTLFHGLRF